MPPTNPPKTRKEILRGIPTAKLASLIRRYQADEDYLSHEAIAEDAAGTKWTLEVILKDE